MLTKRQNSIITILDQQKDWLIGKDLAALLAVSDRTIRNDIAAINEFYKDTVIESNIRKGYRIQANIMKNRITEKSSEVPETGEERRNRILMMLLKVGQRNVHDISEQMCISEFAMENDINRIRKLLENYQELKLVRKNSNLQLVGEEREKRHLYEELIAFQMSGNLLNITKIAENFSAFDLIRVKSILAEIFEESDYQISEIQIPGLLIHLGVVLERIFSYHFIREGEQGNTYPEMQEYEISKRFFEKLVQRLSIKTTEEEIYDFALYLKRVKMKAYDKEENTEKTESRLVTQIIMEIKEHFDIDFSEDREFRLGLELHITALLKRHSEQIEIDNTCLEEVKKKYPLIFEMGVWVCKIIEESLEITINENEISFLSLHIGSAYERANLRKKYRCVLICPHNRTVTDLCVQKIVNRFNERLEVVKCMSYFEEMSVMDEHPDLILTTQPLVHSLDIITVEISMFFDHKDEASVFRVLNRLDQNRYKNNFQFFILNLIREEIFMIDMEREEPEEILSEMCDRLYARGYVKEGFKEGVLKRERLSSTSFFHGFAIPHSMENQSTVHSAIGTAILKKPVKWGQYEVRFVFLLAITEEKRTFLTVFFDWLTGVVSQSERFARLLEVRDYNSFVSTLLNS